MADRSPNYPAFPLSKAVEWCRALKTLGGRNAVHIETVAKAAGSEATKGISGPTRQKIGAMKQFGMIESAAHGQYRLSPLGFDLALHLPADDEYKTALKKAALSPPLFAEVYNRYDELPHDHELSIGLQKGQFGADFSPEAAKRFIKAFKDTLSFAKLNGERYTESQGDESFDSNDSGDSGQHDGGASQGGRKPQGGKLPPISLRIQPGVTAQITFAGGVPTPKAIEKLIAHLDLMKDEFGDSELSDETD